MNYNRKVLLGFGTFRYENGTVDSFVQSLNAAYQSKYDYIDTAKYYENEAEIGQALVILKEKYGENFHFPVQTKVWTEDYLDAYNAVLGSMERLQLKQLDSVLLHRPSTNLANDISAWKDLIKLQKEGLVKQIGVSNYDNEMLYFFKEVTGVLPTVNQIQFNIYNARLDRYFNNSRIGISLQAWRPLTFRINELLTDPVVQELAKKHQTTPTGIAIAFNKFLGIDPIIKSTHPERIIANAQAFHTINLEEADVSKLLSLNRYDDGKIDFGSASYPINPEYAAKLKAEVDFLRKNK
ncbi:2,5-diketo-D-gluconate reductase A [Mycoplasmoides fastidiosum]|uniref:2,5-diketo-D-gluconate reductase A n=1 Tax=Mycoplasmoides fastidiosum TaxID=92758 RepID=A0ABU0M009_9BACT|nr:aldo/keto reductase [Mycoplasmoides fastidiosum]MDQ0514277.1 2,5-diketo-D-gluconate reductase A [Mycoplasmoides fastidiosum]UUD38119.1 aldo/keto reductase [Mycoplasmoides fastidiosum]